MNARIASHAQLLHVNAHLARRAVEGLSVDELWRRPGDGSNPILSVLAHVVATRYGMVRLIGGQTAKPSWAGSFERGQPFGRPANPPDLAEVLQALDSVGAAIDAALERATDEQLSTPCPIKFPLPDTSMRGAVVFFAFHETYHVGQLAYLRKWLGYPGLVG